MKRRVLDALSAAYKRVLSPLLHSATGFSGACRFQPTCSEYATLALHHHGLVRGGALAVGRLLRCHPGSSGGFDPVPGTWPSSQPMQTSSGPSTIEAVPVHGARPPV